VAVPRIPPLRGLSNSAVACLRQSDEDRGTAILAPNMGARASAGKRRSMAVEFAERGLHIHAIAPGYMPTIMGNGRRSDDIHNRIQDAFVTGAFP
jgi:hypothetical protein